VNHLEAVRQSDRSARIVRNAELINGTNGCVPIGFDNLIDRLLNDSLSVSEGPIIAEISVRLSYRGFNRVLAR